MRRFTLKFPADELGDAKRIDFESDDAHEAFSILEQEKVGRHVELYEEENLLGVITRDGRERWLIEH